jgi:hypothetical protein
MRFPSIAGRSAAHESNQDVDRGYDAVAVNGEPVHVEKTNESTAAREAVDRASDGAQPVARGVDYQQCCVLPCSDGTAGLPVSIERGAGVAARSLLDERRVPLLVSASR